MTSIEGEHTFNDMAVVPGTGLAFFAAENRSMKAYFIPSLGAAPDWCSHLDVTANDMEEEAGLGDSAVAQQVMFNDQQIYPIVYVKRAIFHCR